MKRCIITIGRTYGSGGRIIGEELARRLNIPFYDKNLIELAARERGLDPEVMAALDEKAGSSFLYSLTVGMQTGAGRLGHLQEGTLNDRLFLAQAEVIRRAAKEGSCVIVGRCADYVLREDPNLLSVFVHAPLEDRVLRVTTEYGEPRDKAEQLIAKTDKRRDAYYRFYTGRRWQEAEHYHISLDSSSLGIRRAVDLLAACVETD